MHGNLLDEDSYPRSDIDIYQVRLARQRIICLQNDHRELMAQIENLLHRLHAEQRATAAGLALDSHNATTNGDRGSSTIDWSNGSTAPFLPPSAGTTTMAPFLIINYVANGSPADVAVRSNHAQSAGEILFSSFQRKGLLN